MQFTETGPSPRKMPGRGKLELTPKNTSSPPNVLIGITNQGGNKLISKKFQALCS